MWMLLPALCIAVAHIAGDNIAVVPDMAVSAGTDIYITTIVAYMLFGSLIAGLSAWIGVKSGYELLVVVKRLFGCRGKKMLAIVILAVCIPASALTGGYYSGWALYKIIGLTPFWGMPLSLLLFSVLAAGYGTELLKLSNYISLLLVPLIVVMMFASDLKAVASMNITWNVDWLLVCALIGYNVGGMRPVLVVETATYLAQKGYKAILLVILAKLFEGILTLFVAHLVLISQAYGPLALSGAFTSSFDNRAVFFFDIILFCTFMNTMAPAMMVNAKQVSILTGVSFWPALSIAAFMVYLGTFADFNTIILLMSITGLIMAAFIIYTAYFLHKNGIKQS
ncbi:hypothetical protein SDC9_30265 [bioreactor metagenome]|uniref:Uncharacterized protein n=1 Tax=bioreactor metagenome TaxID=1076179 RepID=A0A644UZ23_9ZZZZ|nr:hypothetical protein [Negativicutes bacterium]